MDVYAEMKKLESQYKHSELTRAVCIWVADHGLSMYKPVSVAKPEVLRRYESLETDLQRSEFNKVHAGWMEYDECRKYYDSKNQNKSNLMFLKQCVQYLHCDQPRRDKVQVVVDEFEKGFAKEDEPEVQNWVNHLQGQVVEEVF